MSAVAARRRFGRMVLGLPVHIIVFALMILWFTPVLGMFASSVRTQADAASSGWWTLLVAPLFTGYNYQQALNVVGIGESTITSLIISVPVTILTTLISAVGAFALTRMPFAGRTALSIVLVALLVVPPQVTLVPLLQLFGLVGLTGTVPAVWIYQVGFTIPFGIFLLRGFIASVPDELFEAASLDGAGALRQFWSVVLPVSAPVLASLAILQFMWSWNDLLIPLIFLGGSGLEAPLTVQIAGLAQSYNQGQALQMAAAALSVILPLALIIGLQRYFVSGVLGGAVKE